MHLTYHLDNGSHSLYTGCDYIAIGIFNNSGSLGHRYSCPRRRRTATAYQRDSGWPSNCNWSKNLSDTKIAAGNYHNHHKQCNGPGRYLWAVQSTWRIGGVFSSLRKGFCGDNLKQEDDKDISQKRRIKQRIWKYVFWWGRNNIYNEFNKDRIANIIFHQMWKKFNVETLTNQYRWFNILAYVFAIAIYRWKTPILTEFIKPL